MRAFVLVACLAALGAIGSGRAAEPLDPRLRPLAWLAGEWLRTDLPAGTTGVERWQVEGRELVGAGIRRKGAQVLFQEGLRLQADARGVVYVAEVAGNAAPVPFRLTSQGPGTAVFENPAHDFPKKIVYRLEGDRLEVRTSGAGREAVFRFARNRPPADSH